MIVPQYTVRRPQDYMEERVVYGAIQGPSAAEDIQWMNYGSATPSLYEHHGAAGWEEPAAKFNIKFARL